MLSIRLPSEIENRLTLLAERTGRTKTYYAKEAIISHLDKMEQEYADHISKSWEPNQETLEAVESARRGEVTHYKTLEEMFTSLKESEL